MAVKLQKELVQIEYLWTLDTWEPTAFVINVESGVKHLKAPMSAITNVILGWKILNEEKALLWLVGYRRIIVCDSCWQPSWWFYVAFCPFWGLEVQITIHFPRAAWTSDILANHFVVCFTGKKREKKKTVGTT